MRGEPQPARAFRVDGPGSGLAGAAPLAGPGRWVALSAACVLHVSGDRHALCPPCRWAQRFCRGHAAGGPAQEPGRPARLPRSPGQGAAAGRRRPRSVWSKGRGVMRTHGRVVCRCAGGRDVGGAGRGPQGKSRARARAPPPAHRPAPRTRPHLAPSPSREELCVFGRPPPSSGSGRRPSVCLGRT